MAKTSNQTYGRDIVANNYYDTIQEHAGNWIKKWNTAGYEQQNGATNKGYKGQNQLNLLFEQIKRNSTDPRWMTMTQIVKNKFRLEKGSKGAKVEFHSNYTERVKKDEAGKPILDESGNMIKEKIILPFHVGKHAVVFNAKNIIGIEPFKSPVITDEQKKQMESEKNKRINSIIEKFQKETGIQIKEIPSSKACFIRSELEGHIVLPLRTQFQNLDSFYSVAFHEMAHATSMLEGFKRPDIAKNDWKAYAKEELRAETTALLMMKEYGGQYEPRQTLESNSFEYLKAWINQGVITRDDFKEAFSDAIDISKLIKSFDIEREKSNTKENKTQTQQTQTLQTQQTQTLNSQIDEKSNDEVEL